MQSILKKVSRAGACGSMLLAAQLAGATCPEQSKVDAYIADFQARRPNASFSADLNAEDAVCARRKLITAFTATLGAPVGYRAAFSNDMTRALLHMEQPMWGAMYRSGFLKSPATVALKYGAVPYWDADMLIEIDGPGLAEARTPMEALRHVNAVIPFVELKDNMNSDTESTEHFIAINAGFRSGVLGARIPVRPTKRFLDALAKMDVVTLQGKRVLASAKGSVLMDGHPLNAAIWLARALKENGIELKKGDLLGLGGFSMAQPPVPNVKIEVRYKGLPGNPTVALQFE